MRKSLKVVNEDGEKVDLVKKKIKSSQRRQRTRLTVRAKFEFSVNYLVDL